MYICLELQFLKSPLQRLGTSSALVVVASSVCWIDSEYIVFEILIAWNAGKGDNKGPLSLPIFSKEKGLRDFLK